MWRTSSFYWWTSVDRRKIDTSRAYRRTILMALIIRRNLWLWTIDGSDEFSTRGDWWVRLIAAWRRHVSIRVNALVSRTRGTFLSVHANNAAPGFRNWGGGASTSVMLIRTGHARTRTRTRINIIGPLSTNVHIILFSFPLSIKHKLQRYPSKHTDDYCLVYNVERTKRR